MAHLLYPPDDLSQADNGIKLVPVNLDDEDPAFVALLRQQVEVEKSAKPLAAGSWYRAGPGPAPTVGGTWIGGTTLAPLSTPSAGIVSSFVYSYDNTHYNGWGSQISVRMYITDASVSKFWQADITSANSGTVTATGSNIPANCRVTFQMKVGNVTGSLFNPPYISTDEVTVNYS